jgi:hypothetical protein
MPVHHFIGLLLLLPAAGCAMTDPPETSSSREAPPAAHAPAPPDAGEPPAVSAAEPAAPAVQTEPVVVPAKPVPDTRSAVTTKPQVPAPVKAATPQPPQQKTVVAAPAPAAPPPMALATLEQRLKDTDAIGVFTKLALKNQVDDLLNRAKTHHLSNGNTTLAQLRQSYDQLLSKVHGLLKDGDPALAKAIIASREALWTVLADPVKFAKL